MYLCPSFNLGVHLCRRGKNKQIKPTMPVLWSSAYGKRKSIFSFFCYPSVEQVCLTLFRTHRTKIFAVLHRRVPAPAARSDQFPCACFVSKEENLVLQELQELSPNRASGVSSKRVLHDAEPCHSSRVSARVCTNHC